jgi:hypothetical protein
MGRSLIGVEARWSMTRYQLQRGSLLPAVFNIWRFFDSSLGVRINPAVSCHTSSFALIT